MKDERLSSELREQARDVGLCNKWYREWNMNSTQGELISKYLEGINFCNSRDYPNLDFVKEYFDHGLMMSYGVIVDDAVELKNKSTVVLLGKSSGTLSYSDRNVGNIYVRHDSDVTVTATDGAKVFVESWNDCKVHAIADESSKIFVYDHGGTVTFEGNVTVRNKKTEG